MRDTIKELIRADYEFISSMEKKGKLEKLTVLNLITGKLEEVDLKDDNLIRKYLKV